MMRRKRNTMLGVLAVAATLLSMTVAAQPPAPQSQTPAQQQNIPDAPKPQALPSLTPLNTVGPALPSAPAPAAPKADDNGGVVPGATLPSTPAPTADAQQQTAEEADQGPPPDISKLTQLPTVYVNFVQVPFTVKDSRGHEVPGLTYRDVRVYENGVRQQMKAFIRDPGALSVAIVIDQSVPFDVMTKVNNSLASLQGAFSNYDEVAIFTYNNGVRKQTEFTAAQSARLGQVLENSKGKGREFAAMDGGPLSQNITKNGYNLDPNTSPNHGRTVSSSFDTPERESHTLLDAILAAAQETARVDRSRRRVVYVISDGKEWGSVAKEKEVIKYLQANNVEVFATLVGDSAVPGLGFLDRIHLPLMMRDDILPRIVSATGGETDPEFRQGGIEKSFARIAEEVRTQYIVGYYSKLSPLNESFRRTEVRVLRPGLTVIAPDGYYPNAHDSRPTPVTPSAVPH